MDWVDPGCPEFCVTCTPGSTALKGLLSSEYGQGRDFFGVDGTDRSGNLASLLVAVTDDDDLFQSSDVRIQLDVSGLAGSYRHLLAPVPNE